MNIEKADWFMVSRFGTLSDFIRKMEIEEKQTEDLFEVTSPNDGMTILHYSLAYRRFDISDFLISKDFPINCISFERCNELHYLASNIRHIGAIQIGEKLLKKNASLDVIDLRYHNSPLWYLCMEYRKSHSEELFSFIKKCLLQTQSLDQPNLSGYTVRQVMVEDTTLSTLL